MDPKPRFNRICFLVIVWGMLLTMPAYAYIDPNAQGLLTQILTPLLIILATALTFLRKQVGSAIHWLAGQMQRRKDATGE
jgi:hypothetical protein